MYSNIQFMKEESTSCTILSAPIRVRLFSSDLTWLNELGPDVSLFIRSVVHTRIEEIQKSAMTRGKSHPAMAKE
jgi:hypothetical protein